MARGSQQAIEIPVSLQLQNLAEIANSLKKFANENILSDSFNGKKINAELQTVLRTLAQIEARAKNGFKVDSDFGGLNKDINRVELSLDNVYKSISRLHFEDLQIPEDVQGRLQELNAEIKQLRDNFNGVKEAQKNALVNNGQFVLDLNKAFPANSSKIIGKTYDEIGQAIQNGTAKIQARLDEQQRILQQKQLLLAENKAGQANFAAQNVLNFLEKGFKELPKNPDAKLNEQQQILQQYMKISADDKGNREFSSFKNGASYNSFFNYLVKQYELTPEQLDQIKQRIRDQMAATKKSAAQVMKEMALDREIGAKIMVNTSRDQMIDEASKYASQVKDTSATEATVQKLREQGNAANAAWQSFQGTISIVSAANEQLKGALQGPQAELEKLQQSVLENVIALPQFSQAQQQAAASLDQLRAAASVGEARLKQMNETVSKMDGVSNFINRYIGLYAIVRKVSTAIRNAFDNIKELDKTITSIAVVTNMSQADLWGKIGEYTQMAQQYGVAVKGVYEVSQIFYQQGLQTSQVMALTTETLKMAKIAGIDYSTAANAMTVAVRAFKLEMTDAQQVTDTYSALAAKFAVSSAEIANAMEKTASSAASVGMSLESTSAFISVMEQTTRESAQNIGSALKSIISRYGEMKASPAKLINVDGEEVAFNKVDTALKSVGISIKDTSGQFRDFDDVIMDLAQKWNSLDNNTQRYIATIMAGNRQQSRFIALVSNYDELSRSMDTAANAENASIVQVAKTMDSLESKANQLQNAFQQLYLDLHIENGLKATYDWLTKILKTIGKLGVGKGLLPSLMNVIGLGTGTKKLIGMGKEAYQNRVKKVQVEVEDKNNKIQEIQAWISKPEEKVIQLKMDDSQIQQTQATIQTATSQAMIGFKNQALGLANKQVGNQSVKLNSAEIYSQLKTARDNGELQTVVGRETLLNNLGIDKQQVGEQQYSQLDTFLQTIGSLNSQAQTLGTTLQALGVAAEGAAQSEEQKTSSTQSNIEADYEAARAKQQSAQSDLDLATKKQQVAFEEAMAIQEKDTAERRAAQGVLEKANAEVGAAQAAKDAADADVKKLQPAYDAAQADRMKVMAAGGQIPGQTQPGQAPGQIPPSGGANQSKTSPWEGKEGLMKGIGIASGFARIVGTAITALGAAHEDKSTDSVEMSKIYTGIGNGLSAAGTGASMGMAFGPWGAAIGAIGGFLLGGLGAIIDGAEMTLAEKIALQKEEAQKAQDENLKAQAKATDLSSQIDNIKNLKKVMYDSTEDMQAYKDAMNTMSDQYPQLISSYDEAGNAIIDLNSAEEALAEARLAGARAAREASIKEATYIDSQLNALQLLQDEVATINHESASVGQVQNVIGNVTESQTPWTITFSPETNKSIQILGSTTKEIESGWGIDESGSQYAIYSSKYRDAIFEILNNIGVDQLRTLGYLNNNQSIEDITWTQLNKFFTEHPVEYEGHFSRPSEYVVKIGDNTYGTSKTDIREYIKQWITPESYEQYKNAPQMKYNTQGLNKIIASYKDTDLFEGKETVEDWLGQDSFTYDQIEIILNNIEKKLVEYEKKRTNVVKNSGYNLAQESLFNAADISTILTTPQQVTNLESNNIYSRLFYQRLLAEKGDYSDLLSWYNTENSNFPEKSAEVANSFIEWYINLTSAQKEILESLDFTEYTSVDQIMGKIGLSSEDSQYEAIAAQFIESNKANRDRILKTIYSVDENGEITNKLNTDFLKYNFQVRDGSVDTYASDYYKKVADFFEEDANNPIISKYADYFTTSLVDINKLAEEGYTELASNRLQILSAFADSLSSMNSSEQQDMFGILTQVDLSSYESIQTAKESLKNYTKEKGITFEGSQFEELWKELDEAENKLIFNVTTLANTLTTQIESAAKEMDSILSTNKSGLSFDKALEEYKTLSAKFNDLGSFNTVFSYDAVLGKYIYTQDGLQKAIQAREQNLQNTAERLSKEAEKYNKIIYKDNNGRQHIPYFVGRFTEWEDQEKIEKQFKDFQWGEWETDLLPYYQSLLKQYYEAERENRSDIDFINFIQEIVDTNSKEAEAAQKILQEYQANKKNQYYQAIDWSKLASGTDITGTNETLMKSLASELKMFDLQANKWLVDKTSQNWQSVLDTYLTSLYGIQSDDGTYTMDGASKEQLAKYNEARATLLGEIATSTSQQAITAINEILSGAGTQLSETTRALVDKTKYNEKGQLKAGLDYVQSALDVFNAQKENFTTATERNAAYRAILDKQFEDANATISFLSSGAALDGSAIDNFFNTLGLNLDEFYDGVTNQWKNGLAKYLSTDMFGKTKILDWEGFIKKLNLSEAFTNTYEYQNAYSAYVDGLITLDTQLTNLVKQQYDNAFSSIAQFKQLNVSQLSKTYTAHLAANGAGILDNNGILKIEDTIQYAHNAIGLFSHLSSLNSKQLYDETGWTSADLASNWKAAQTILTESYNAWTSISQNITALTDDNIATLIEKGGLKIGDMNELFTRVGDKYIMSLATYREQLINIMSGEGNLSPHQLYQVEQAYNVAQEAIISQLNSMNWESILNGTATENEQSVFQEVLAASLEAIGLKIEDYYSGNKLDINAVIQAVSNADSEIGKALSEHISEVVAEIQNNALSAISSAATYNIEGINDITSMQKFVDEYNKLIPEEQISIRQVFGYDTLLNQFTLNTDILNKYIEAQKKQLENLGLSGDAIDEYIKDQTQTILQQNMDITSILSNTDKRGRQQAGQELSEAIQKYMDLGNKIIYPDRKKYIDEEREKLSKLLNSTADSDERQKIVTQLSKLKDYENESLALYTGEIVRLLYNGGERAVNVLKQLKGEEVTSEEIQAVYRAAMDRLNEASDQLTRGIGETISGTAVTILQAAEYGLEELDDGTYVIKTIGDMVKAYNILYQTMAKTDTATTAELNSTYAKMLTAYDQPEIDAISTLNDAMGMTYEALGDMLANYGIQLEDVMKNVDEWGLQSIGNGKIQIYDFKDFAAKMGWNFDSEEYLSAFKAYNDSLIELNGKTEKAILDEVKNLSDAKIGDKINLTYLWSKISNNINALGTKSNYQYQGQFEAAYDKVFGNYKKALESYGATFVDGILTISAEANIQGIITTIAQLASENAALLPEELAELADMVSEYIDNIINLIKNGISGNLKNVDAQKLQSWADQFHLNLDFTQTAEGLKLSQKSAIELYNALKGVDNIKARLVFDELNKSLQETNEHYKSISDILNRIAWIEDKDHPVRASQYEKELALAKEILAVRSTSEDSSFNFMSNKIPGGQNNPINYFNNWADAIQKLQTAMSTSSMTSKGKKTGLIDYQDWYNIITELNNLAGRTQDGLVIGNNIEGNAIKLDGSLEAAAALIEKGASALTVDSTGKIKVALGDIGIDFQAGAGDMSAGIDTGIKEMASSQVKMLDGMIRLLEVIVQMEKLGDITGENDTIDLKDLFPKFDGTNLGDLDSNVSTWIDGIFKAAEKNKDLKLALEQIKINDEQLGTLLKQMQNGEITVENAKAITGILDSMWKMYQSGDWDLDNLYQSLAEIAEQSGLGGELTLDIDNTTLVINGGKITQINWEDVNTKEVLNKWKEKTGGERTDLINAINRYQAGEAVTDEEIPYVLAIRGIVEFNSDGSVASVTVNGKEYRGEQALAAMRAQALIDAGLTVTNDQIENAGKDGSITQTTTIGKHENVIVTSDSKGITWTDKKTGATGKTQQEMMENAWKEVQHRWENQGKTKEQYLWEEWDVRANITAKVTKDNVQIDVANDASARKAIENKIQNLAEDELQLDNTGNLDLELENGIHVTLKGETVVGKDGKTPDQEKVKAELMKILGLDQVLQDNIKLGIVAAFTEIPNIELDANIEKALAKVNELKEAAKQIDTNITVGINTVPAKILDNTDFANRHPAVQDIVTGNGGGTQAKGNVALAQGTLMGELGPELYVTNGRYYVAGQSGAEFVNLPSDAIVFNHQQTASLLKNGKAGRGKPITNESNAISYAKGNVNGGPAMASASAALAALRQLRAQWKALMDLGVADLAGKGGGGGGGGDKDLPGFIRDIERWYNWLQKIADLEKQITYQEQLRSKIQSDMVPSGKAYYASLQQTYEDAKDSALTSQSLFLSQKESFNKRREQLNNSPLSELYTFDETGQLHYQEGSFNWLAQLFKTDDFGQLALNPQQQYEMILSRNPEFAQYMKYNSEGKEIKQEDYKDNKDQYYLDMVKAFSDRMDAEKEEMQNLFDSWNDQQKAVLEQMQKMNAQLQAMKDNQKEVEESVLKAIVESRERQIKEMEDTKNALQKTNQEFIDGLSKQLDKEQKMYQNNEKDQELQRNRRQLAILQRSGGSASQISSLQKQIEQQSRDQYFEKQQEQIDAVKEASNLQIERLDHQIEIEQEALEYQKANGLLWSEVYNVMKGTPEQITNFIASNTADFWDESPLAKTEKVNKLIFETEQWTQFRDDTKMQKAAMGRIDQNLEIFLAALEQIYGDQANWEEIKAKATEDYNKYYGIDNNDPNKAAWDSYPGKNDIETKNTGKQTTGTTNIATTTTNTPNKTTDDEIDRNTISKSWYYDDVKHWKTAYTKDGRKIRVLEDKHVKDKGVSDGNRLHYKCKTCGCDMGFIYEGMAEGLNKNAVDNGIANKSQQYNKISRLKSSVKNNNSDIEIIPLEKGVPKAANGAIVDQSGAAIIHDNEVILTAEQTRFLRDDILSNKSTSLLGILSSLHSSYKDISANTINNSEGNVIIENATVQMNVQKIADDYDARRAGDQAMEEMLRIARKSGTRSV